VRARRLALPVLVTVGLLAAVSLPVSSAIASSTTTTVADTTTTGPSSTTTTTVPTTTTTTIPAVKALPWPSQGSAAVAVPQFSIDYASPVQPRVPIASLTKLMTTWVVLQALPLTYSQHGPCLVVGRDDQAEYDHEVAIGESNVKITRGLRLCEGTLLRGLLVHSAGDYAALLVKLMGATPSQFVTLMNWSAKALGLRHTHYADFTGISPRDTSTAQDQATLAIDLMGAQPVVRGIVALAQVRLPVAGIVGSYTPLIGQYGVVGVKSGFTDPAGGCDVMAVQSVIRKIDVTTYVVVLGQHSGDPLASAGLAALRLARTVNSALSRDRSL
jgi:serine-type D-Ala-D-Ala carboxypeptidase (penicillin-binding protein 5/6)